MVSGSRGWMKKVFIEWKKGEDGVFLMGMVEV